MKLHKTRIYSICLILVVVLTQVINPSRAYAANINVNSAATLIAAINTANTNNQDDVITLTESITLTAANNSVNGLPVILSDGGSSLTIDGAGFSISRVSASSFRIFEIANGANFTITNLTLSDGYISDANGGGILVNNGATVNISNTTFDGNNTLNGYGGAIYVDTATLSISNSTFSNNSANVDAHPDGVFALGGTTRRNWPSSFAPSRTTMVL